MKRNLSSDHRGRLAEKLMEWGNLTFIGLVVSQILPGGSFHWGIGALGIGIFFFAYLFARSIMKGGA